MLKYRKYEQIFKIVDDRKEGRFYYNIWCKIKFRGGHYGERNKQKKKVF